MEITGQAVNSSDSDLVAEPVQNTSVIYDEHTKSPPFNNQILTTTPESFLEFNTTPGLKLEPPHLRNTPQEQQTMFPFQ